MTGQAKVTAGLEKLRDNAGCIDVHDADCKTCPYKDVDGCCNAIITDAIALLKAQDKEMQYRTAKKVEHKATLYRCCTCPSCGNVVGSFEQWGDRQVRITVEFCMFCGQRLDWSDELMEGR